MSGDKMENIDVYVRNENGLEDDDTWDDKVLVEAYNKSVNRIKKNIAKRLGIVNGNVENCTEPKEDAVNDQKVLKKGVGKIKWKVGDYCRANYSVDGVDYEAKIIKILSSGQCIVKYFGYDNEEVVRLKDLKKTLGNRFRVAQMLAATQSENIENSDFVESVNESFDDGILDVDENSDWSPIPTIPPPPPLNVLAQVSSPGTESDALSAMLMSWYMTGYHTGYYQGLMQSKKRMRKLPKK